MVCPNMNSSLRRLHRKCKLFKPHSLASALFVESQWRGLGTSPVNRKFWERHIKAEYRKEESKIPTKKEIVDGLRIFKTELGKWKQEQVDRVTKEPLFIVRPGEVDTVFKFDSEEALSTWVVTADKDNREGNSSAELVLGQNGKAVFRGNIDTTVPKDGATQRAGYANMRCMRPRKSFLRESFFNWTGYTHLVVRARGDGRPYMLNLASMGYFDVMWNDVYSFPLHTRGGPYWQISRIPFSRFFLTGKGRIQDKQSAVDQDRVTHVGITCAGVSGAFQLEIDYIGLEMDPKHEERFAYEMYRAPSFVPGV